MKKTCRIKETAAVLVCLTTLFGCSCTADNGDIKRVTENIPKALSSETETVTSDTVAAAAAPPSGELLKCNFYDEKTFIMHDRTSEAYDIGGTLSGGVVTHHLLAGRMIAGFFKTAAENRGSEIKTVVITAPMHYPEKSALCTSLLDWQTPYGTAVTDKSLTQRLITELKAEENVPMLEKDHSASSLLPYIKYYLPDAEVCCLLVSPKSDRNTPEKLAKLYKEMSEEKSCLFVFSIDFSHYLSPEEAEAMDAVTLDAVQRRDTEQISFMTDDNLDSPRCMCTFIELMGLLNCDISVRDNGNSMTVSGLPYNELSFPEGVTSYFVFFGTAE